MDPDYYGPRDASSRRLVDFVLVLQGAGEGGAEAEGPPVGGDGLILVCVVWGSGRAI